MTRKDAIRIVRLAQDERADGAGNDCFEVLKWRRNRTTCAGALRAVVEDLEASGYPYEDELAKAVEAHVENELAILRRKCKQYKESHPKFVRDSLLPRVGERIDILNNLRSL